MNIACLICHEIGNEGLVFNAVINWKFPFLDISAPYLHFINHWLTSNRKLSLYFNVKSKLPAVVWSFVNVFSYSYLQNTFTYIGQRSVWVFLFPGVNLLKAVDSTKCQTLFLSQISQGALQRSLFPVGDMLKRDVKELARKAGLERIADKKEVISLCIFKE